MAMLAKCAAAVQAAAQAMGRAKLTDAQLRQIDERLSATMRRLARQDRARWSALSADQRLTEAGKAAVAELQAEAALKAQRAALQVTIDAASQQRIAALRAAKGGSTQGAAAKKDFSLTHLYARALHNDAMGSMMDLLRAAGSKQGLGLGRKIISYVFDTENRVMTRDIVREIYRNADGHTGNKAASMAARAWLDTMEGLRTRFNGAGGDVGKLDYGYVPQPWDRARVKKQQDAFAQFILQGDHLDRSRYLHEDGAPMTDQEVWNLLNDAAHTIWSGGIYDHAPGEFKGQGARANRGSETRAIHFKDGESWLAVMERFGQGSLFDAMQAHVQGMTRSIALVERHGPNPEANARLQFDLIAQADERVGGSLSGPFEVDPKTYWNMVSGKVGMPVDEGMHRAFSMARAVQSGARLGGALISSITDLGTLALTAGYNKLGYWQLVKDIGSQASKETRDWMSSHGMIADSAATALNRFSGDMLGQHWSGKIAASVFRISLMNAWIDGLRQGFTLTMNAGLARMAKKTWAQLDRFDREHLGQAGFTEADWSILNGIAPTMYKGRELLTPQSIKDAGHQDLAARVFGFIIDEAETAVVNPDLTTRAIMTWGGKEAGTYSGEIARTIMQFKSFPVAMLTRHWDRLLNGPMHENGLPVAVNRTLYGFGLTVTLMGLGAIATQEKQILQGKDPIDMTKGKFWIKAAAQGGAAGPIGDLILESPSAGAGDAVATFLKAVTGPTLTSAGELLKKVVLENIWQEEEGKESHWQAELASWAYNQTPTPLKVWWLRPFIDHGFMNELNETMSPGYLSRMKQKAMRDWGQHFYWDPREPLPERPPDMQAALGR